jgi:hypothetical protein
MTSIARTSVLVALGWFMAGTALASGPWRASEGNTTGWQLMSSEERIAHQAQIRSFDSYDACHAYQLEHHQLMLVRAKAQGLTLRTTARDACEALLPAATLR